MTGTLRLVFLVLVLVFLPVVSGWGAGPGARMVQAVTPVETPAFAAEVAAGTRPPVAERLPGAPKIVPFDRAGQSVGRHGGTLQVLMARARDTRALYTYGYARLVAYTPDWTLEPDILERVDVEGGRRFTFHLRPGHRWSDGEPFTTEDFRYWWRDVLLEPALRPFGPPEEMRVEGELPVFEVLDATTVRYTWSRPNPFFLPALADARALPIYGPAHYLRLFHARHADPDALAARVADSGLRHWPQLHNRLDNAADNDNPDLPTLQPWVVATRAPAERFLFRRNPYYHRVDPAGRQLPYIDNIVMQVVDSRLVPAKTAAGEADLQARYLRFDDYTFLKAGETRGGYDVRLWQDGVGGHLALYPNLNHKDPVWRTLLRDERFRRALSLGIDREEINQVVYFGLARASNNTVVPQSPLWRADYQTAWAVYRPEEAALLLNALGLARREGEEVRRLPDGRPLEILVETADAGTEETDVLELIADSWRKLGIRLLTRPAQIETLRNRIYAGETLMTIAKGLENGTPTPDMSPAELAPVDQGKYQWPRWGQYAQTRGAAGEPPALPAARRLLELLDLWRQADDTGRRADIWHAMLAIHADQVFTIGIVNATRQPVVVRRTLRNVPDEAIYNYTPGAHFGVYRPDGFWFEASP